MMNLVSFPRVALIGLFCALILLVKSLWAGSSTADDNSSDSIVSIKLSVLDSESDNGKVIIEALLTNSSGREIDFLPWNTPFDSSVNGDIFNVKHLGKNLNLSYQGRMVKRLAPKVEDYKTIKAGQTLVNRLEITDSYGFCAESEYEIFFDGLLFNLQNIEIEFAVNRVRFSTGSQFAVCD